MAVDDAVVRVVGIPDLQKALRQLDKSLPRELAEGLQVAAEIVAAQARPKVPYVSGDAVASIKTRKQQRAAALAVGGSKAPYFPWLDFGGSTGRGHVPKRAGSGAIKREWLGKPVGDGRYIYPSLREKRHEVVEAVDEVLESMAKRAGFETTGDGTRA